MQSAAVIELHQYLVGTLGAQSLLVLNGLELTTGGVFTVSPEPLVLVRLRKDMIQESAYGLTQLVLLCNNKQRSESKQEPQSDDISFWCYCETAEEISLMMNEVRSFAPPEAP